MSDWSDGVSDLGGVAGLATGGLPGLAIGIGSKLLGGLFGDKSARNQAAAQANIQREFAQNGIRWRVADAKAAGLHPLFALGGSGATYSPAPITTHTADAIGSMGQDVSRAVQAQASQPERRLLEGQLTAQRASAEKDFAQASYYRSLEARNLQSANIAAPIDMEDHQDPGDARRLARWAAYSSPTAGSMAASGSPRVIAGDIPRVTPGAINPKPHDVTSARKGDSALSAGRPPMWEERVVVNRQGREVPMVVMQGGDPGESFEGMAGVLTISENIRRYGLSWLRDAFGSGSGPSDFDYRLLDVLNPSRMRPRGSYRFPAYINR